MHTIYLHKQKECLSPLHTNLVHDIHAKGEKTPREKYQFLTAGSFPVRCPIRCALRNQAEVDAITENFYFWAKTLIFCLFPTFAKAEGNFRMASPGGKKDKRVEDHTVEVIS